MLLIGRERGKGQIGKIPGPSPSKSGKIPEKSGKSKKGQKRKDKSRSGNPPVCNPPRLAALEYSAERAGVKRACPNKVMAHIWFIHDAHLGHAFLFLEMMAE